MKILYLSVLLLLFLACSSPLGMSDKTDSSFLQLRKETGLSPKLIKKLIKWRAIPDWLEQVSETQNDWAESLHHNVVKDSSWPNYMKNLNVKSETVSNGRSYIAKSSASTIRISNITPVYLRELTEILNYPLVPPNSDDPNAKMLFDTTRIENAVRQLERFQGMISETGYFEGTNVLWGAAEIFGSRFIYYHELAHANQYNTSDTLKVHLLSEEEYLKYEIEADQFALSMIALELRHADDDTQVLAFIGIATAMSLIATSEYTEPYVKNGYRSIKGAIYRISRLIYYANIAVKLEYLNQEAINAFNFYLNLMKSLLSRIDHIPNPVFELVYQTADQPKKNWTIFRNQVVKWCIFGDRNMAIRYLKEVYNSALTQSLTEPRAKRALEVYEYLFHQTEGLDWNVNLRKSITE